MSTTDAPVLTAEEVESRDDRSRGLEGVAFFSSLKAVGALIYFKVDQPDQLHGAEWIWAANTSQQHRMMMKAFDDGRKVHLEMSEPRANVQLDDALCARAYTVRIDFQP